MFVAIANTPRDYAWGSTTAIAELLGTTPSGGPEAELWFGAHPGSPSRIVEPALVSGALDLADWIADDPSAALGERSRLSFLMKVLAAASPLSLQAHPTAKQAREGFARENALGIPLDAPHRNYRDEFSKPEVIVAVSETFTALCGFRPKHDAAEALTVVGLDELVPRLDDVAELFGWLMVGGSEVDAVVGRLATRVAQRAAGDDHPASESVVASEAWLTARLLGESYPGDPGIVCALLLNRVTLQKGEAMYLPAGSIHAYLEGVGIEVMTASDTVLRGGLTPKHVDVPELLRVLDFTQGPPPRLDPVSVAPAVTEFRPDVDDFVLQHITADAVINLSGPAIALCLSGAFELSGATDAAQISRGQSIFITPEEQRVSVKGEGSVFLATTP